MQRQLHCVMNDTANNNETGFVNSKNQQMSWPSYPAKLVACLFAHVHQVEGLNSRSNLRSILDARTARIDLKGVKRRGEKQLVSQARAGQTRIRQRQGSPLYRRGRHQRGAPRAYLTPSRFGCGDSFAPDCRNRFAGLAGRNGCESIAIYVSKSRRGGLTKILKLQLVFPPLCFQETQRITHYLTGILIGAITHGFIDEQIKMLGEADVLRGHDLVSFRPQA